MKISFGQLKKLEVQTKSNLILGKVQDLILETEGQNILQYEVSKLVGKKYLISREQVISIDENKMIVEDSVDSELKEEKDAKSKIAIEPEGVMMDQSL